MSDLNNYIMDDALFVEPTEEELKILEQKERERQQIENFKKELRFRRETECFTIINRGVLWYSSLSEEKKHDLKTWYESWLDVTQTFLIPKKPSWV